MKRCNLIRASAHLSGAFSHTDAAELLLRVKPPLSILTGSQWERPVARARRLPGTVSRAPIGRTDETQETRTRAARVQARAL